MQLIQTVLLIYIAVSLHIRLSPGEEECWALVYKIVTGGHGRAYELFMSDKSSNVNDKEAMSLQCQKKQVKKHFKSDIVNNWSNVEIDQVRLSLYGSGIEKAFFVFNGSKTDKTNWFDKSRLITSSYSDLNKDIYFKHFSVKGINGSHYSRRFYIRNDNFKACEEDAGWLLVSDDSGNCQYEKDIEKKPFILFSDQLRSSKANDFAVADIMAIFVKLKIKATCINQFAMHCEHDNLPSTTSSVQTPSTDTNPLDDQSQSTVSTSKDADQSTTMRSEELQNKIDRIKMELTVPKKSTQKYRRSLTSAPDDRRSSKLMGIIGGTFICSVIGLIVLLDCATCNRERTVKAKKTATK